MDTVIKFVEQNLGFFIIGLIFLMVVLSVFFLIAYLKLNQAVKQYKTLMKGTRTKNLEELLLEHAKSVQEVRYKIEEIEIFCDKIYEILEKSVQNVGIIRFNAFNDTGSDLSFAVALLDMKGNGVVISSLYGRSETRSYAKPVQNGTSKYNLSREESEAIKLAMANNKKIK